MLLNHALLVAAGQSGDDFPALLEELQGYVRPEKSGQTARISTPKYYPLSSFLTIKLPRGVGLECAHAKEKDTASP